MATKSKSKKAVKGPAKKAAIPAKKVAAKKAAPVKKAVKSAAGNAKKAVKSAANKAGSAVKKAVAPAKKAVSKAVAPAKKAAKKAMPKKAASKGLPLTKKLIKDVAGKVKDAVTDTAKKIANSKQAKDLVKKAKGAFNSAMESAKEATSGKKSPAGKAKSASSKKDSAPKGKPQSSPVLANKKIKGQGIIDEPKNKKPQPKDKKPQTDKHIQEPEQEQPEILPGENQSLIPVKEENHEMSKDEIKQAHKAFEHQQQVHIHQEEQRMKGMLNRKPINRKILGR